MQSKSKSKDYIDYMICNIFLYGFFWYLLLILCFPFCVGNMLYFEEVGVFILTACPLFLVDKIVIFFFAFIFVQIYIIVFVLMFALYSD